MRIRQTGLQGHQFACFGAAARSGERVAQNIAWQLALGRTLMSRAMRCYLPSKVRRR